ncbi:MAG: bifunctional phosphopantothenoylcysteine decarboxylase/phosphopantothenate--cysteine ligase CoaBC [Flavobacteriales bacterium CG_4_10_14_0_2_um_filter_32_8]|nr:MAG: bifunctional phosphopantothenoylcysteine decarboxylase/phosphopantothenate--cysteine ligase CoaBC [Flavobacteriales bacterium CG_4_10_14_0_2_um_filter_32_8]PJB15060.1 MAG: bifunctional phosphopantothenoylcysteine decarboxylase/phosphopantothenate--cysteine ligase CoaBC [Flavobacteriales bacterium CG_4_9_14_3_um_filter_32_8]
MLSGKNILLGVTGGIAAYKTANLIRLFKKSGANVQVLMTPHSKQFITPLTLSTLSEKPVYSDFSDVNTGEWNSHVGLGAWAAIFIIAPATANSIAKMANGLCDNLLLATYLSAKCPVFIAPAMDLDMYRHATTKENLKKLLKIGVHIIDAQVGELASGLVGKGRMEEPEAILAVIIDYFKSGLPLAGKKVLITAGPTYEQIDPVRFIGNNSSGKMGFELARKAIEMGANVTLIAGPTKLTSPSNSIQRIDVKSAAEMNQEVQNNYKKADIIIMAAAVADYTPLVVARNKLKKTEKELQIQLIATQDILSSIGQVKSNKQLLIGFALETSNEIKNAKEKLSRKNLDLIVLNSLNDKGAGFEYDTNKVTLIDKNNKVEKCELKSKSEVASDIFNKIISLL